MKNIRQPREIPRFPEVPSHFSDKLVDLLSRLCFHKIDQDIPKVDLLFIFGTDISPIEMLDTIKPLLHVSQKVVFTGGFVDYDDSIVEPESVAGRMYKPIAHVFPKTMQVFMQERSKNTLEDVTFTLEMLDASPKTLCYTSRNFHSGRCYLTLKKYLPNCQFYHRSIAEIFPNPETMITRKHWMDYPSQRSLVWGEYLRIKKYGERGDIALDEVKDLITEIGKVWSSL